MTPQPQIDSQPETQYEVVAEGMEYSVHPYSVVRAMIDEYAEDGRKYDERNPYEVHEKSVYQRYAPVKRWLNEIWIDDQCIAREVVNE